MPFDGDPRFRFGSSTGVEAGAKETTDVRNQNRVLLVES